MDWNYLERLWRNQSEETQICFATAAGALLAAACFAAFSLYEPQWITTRGLAVVGMFYLAHGLFAFNRRAIVSVQSSTVAWHRSRLRLLAGGDRIVREAWENN